MPLTVEDRPEYYMEREEVMIRTDWEKVLRDSTSVVAEHQWQSFLDIFLMLLYQLSAVVAFS